MLSVNEYKDIIKSLSDTNIRSGGFNNVISESLGKKIINTLKLEIGLKDLLTLAELNKNQLDSFCSATNLLHTARDHRAEWCKIQGKIPIGDLILSKVHTKMDLLLIVALTVTNDELEWILYNSMSPELRSLWSDLIWKDSVSQLEAADIINRNSTYIKKTAYGQDCLSPIPELADVALIKGYYEYSKTISFCLPPQMRTVLKKFSPTPDGYEVSPIPEPKDTMIWLAEEVILQDLGKLVAYFMQGNIKQTTTGLVNDASIKKLAKTLQIKDFYTDESQHTYLRSGLLANWIVSLNSKKLGINEADTNILKELLNDFSGCKTHSLPFTATRIKGLSYIKNHMHNWIQNYFLNEISSYPEGQWFGISSIEKSLNYKDIRFAPIAISDGTYYLKYKVLDPKWNDWSDHSITEEKFNTMIARNNLYGMFFMLSALGIFDLSYRPIKDTSHFGVSFMSDWEGLEAVRMTQLGAYLLGKSQEYTPPISKEATNILLDENALIILGAEGDSVTDTLLMNYAQKAGGNRYMVSAAHFLKDCKSAKDINTKLAKFKQTLKMSKFPPIWEAFFANLLERAKNISQNTDFVVLTLNPKDKELLQLIAQEKALKELVLKAEGYHILVNKSHLSAFSNRMKELGYLL